MALFGFLSCFLLIGIDSPSANSNSNLYWLANSNIPTEEQMSRLINMEVEEPLTPSDQMETSQIDYSIAGDYPILIQRANNEVEEIIFSIRQHSPIESTIPEIIQFEANQQMDLHQIVQNEMPKKYARIPFIFTKTPQSLNTIHEEEIEGQWTDFYGRQFRKTMKLQVVDQTAPILSIANPQINVQKNEYIDAEKIMQLAGISVYDAVDSSIEPEFQFRNLTTEAEGRYEIIAQAKDRSGNQSIQHYIVVNVSERRTIQRHLGENITEASFLEELGLKNIAYIDWSAVHLDQVGKYEIPIKLQNGQQIIVNFEVIDRKSPKIVLTNNRLVFHVNEKITDALIFEKLAIKSDEKVVVQLAKPIDQPLTKGKYENTLIATDNYGNRTFKRFTIKIIANSMIVSVKNKEPLPSKTFKRKLIRSEDHTNKVETIQLPSNEEKLSNFIEQKPPNSLIALIASVGSMVILFSIITIFNRW